MKTKDKTAIYEIDGAQVSVAVSGLYIPIAEAASIAGVS